VQLGSSRWPDIEATGRTCLLAVPIGSTEQHGPHLPFDTDTRIALEVTTRLSVARPHVVVAPALPFGASGEHASFPGTLLLGHVVLADVLMELIRSARSAFAGVVLVSAHGGNHDGLALLQARCRADGEDVLIWAAVAEGGDAHAGRTETSLMLAIDAGAVRLDLAEAGCRQPLEAILPRLRAEGVRPISSNGVLGDPDGASADEGRVLLAGMTDALVAAVDGRWPDLMGAG